MMTDKRYEGARLQNLEDAIVAATQALGQIAEFEQVVSVQIGEFDASVGGGWYWELTLRAERTIGNTKTIERARGNYRDANARALVRESLAAQMAALDRDDPPVRPVVTAGEAGAPGRCPSCNRPVGDEHRDDCPLAGGDR